MRRALGLLSLSVLIPGGYAKAGASIGVIGGADGPTTVIVSAAPLWWVPYALIAAAAAALIVWRRKRAK